MKKSFVTRAAALVMAALFAASLAGCGAKPAEAQSAPSAQQETAVAQELVIGENVDLGGLDPAKEMSPFIRFLVFDCLVELGYDYEKVPGLATDWKMSEDGKTWTFTLREGVHFHDGEPWNAEAARINFQNRIDAERPGFYKNIESMETPEEYTFVVHLKTPMFTFSSDIAMPTYGMVSPKAFDENHKVTAAIGTGPFVLDDWQKDVQFTMHANEEFYEGAPNLKKLTFKVIPDGNTRAMALESGEIDMMSGRSALTSLEALKQDPNIQVLKTLGQTSEMVQINTFDETMSSLALRKAVAAAADFAGAVPALLSDLAEPAVNFFSPAFGEFLDPELKLPAHDPALADELLTQEGWLDADGDGIREKNGQKLSLELLVDGRNEEDKALAAVFQNQLKEAGIELVITSLDAAAIKDRISSRSYQMAMQGQNYVPTDDPSVHYKNGYYHSGSVNNLYSTPELDEKVDRLFDSLDAEERLQLHKELQKEITAQVPVIMMFHRNNVILARNTLADYTVAKGTWQIYKGLEKARVTG